MENAHINDIEMYIIIHVCIYITGIYQMGKSIIKTHSLKLLSDGSLLDDPLAIIAAIEKSVAPFEAAIFA